MTTEAELRERIDLWREVATVRREQNERLEERLAATQRLVAQQATERSAAGDRIRIGPDDITFYPSSVSSKMVGARVGPVTGYRVPDPEARLTWCPRCSDGPMLIAPRRICGECETEVGVLGFALDPSAMQVVTDRIKAAAAQSARIDDWTRDRTAAIDGAATTLRAHARTFTMLGTLCACGWSVVKGGAYDEHARHVAEQLAAVGALGHTKPVAAQPVLIDREGDEWDFVAGTYRCRAGALTRQELDDQWGPVIEKAIES